VKKIAVTGGLASGKSSLCRFLRQLGAYVVSADEIVHELLTPQTKIGHEVLALLGEEIIHQGAFDRTKIAEIVFKQPEMLKKLEKILHPAVLNAIDAFYLEMKAQKHHPLFVAEVPLLFESESHRYFDKVVAVVCEPSIAKKRYQAISRSSFEEFERRTAHQLPMEQKASRADVTIVNNGTLAELKTKATNLYESLIKGE
jgi:dephospho-CoA kinase